MSNTINPQPLVFFVDRSLGRSVAQALIQKGISAKYLDDIAKFSPDTPDVIWLNYVGQKGWIALTKDMRISRNALERRAAANAGVRMFALNNANLNAQEMASAFCNAIGDMQKFIEKNQAPFIAKIDSKGRVVAKLDSKGEWKPV